MGLDFGVVRPRRRALTATDRQLLPIRRNPEFAVNEAKELQVATCLASGRLRALALASPYCRGYSELASARSPRGQGTALRSSPCRPDPYSGLQAQPAAATRPGALAVQHAKRALWLVSGTTTRWSVLVKSPMRHAVNIRLRNADQPAITRFDPADKYPGRRCPSSEDLDAVIRALVPVVARATMSRDAGSR
jgi:hypothetical protein